MRKIFWILLIVIFLSFLIKADFSLAQQNKVEINFFYSVICPHCAQEKEFLEELKTEYPEIEINQYEVTQYPENQELLKKFYREHKVLEKDKGWIPITFTPEKYFIGFNEQVARNIESCLRECLLEEDEEAPHIIKIPVFGEIDLSKLSLPALTIILGALDGLNPCAMWVLFFLIALLLNTRSRKRMWLIGGIFILSSGIIYFLILSAWLNLFLAIGYVNLTRILIGGFALGMGIWQIRNFLSYHPGVCKVLGMKSKLHLKMKNRAEKIVNSPFTWGMIVGLIGLALAVNLVEFFCSAGLPAIYTRILALNPLTSLSHYSYLILYSFVFMLDDLIIFSVAAITLSKIALTEKYNYWATLIGGLLILILGILLIFKPELLMFG